MIYLPRSVLICMPQQRSKRAVVALECDPAAKDDHEAALAVPSVPRYGQFARIHLTQSGIPKRP
ncbi:hypothetical protein [Belnapia moabensis]|uniref:hypothetical protein n=1 Tax=Belnapia moabensis TaxID=365533 RepID=UPI0005B8317C|nr:hypothetical protein [Belnapia moabensis]